MFKKFSLFSYFIFLIFQLYSQEQKELFTLSEIQIDGLKWTKKQVVVRELNYPLDSKATLEKFINTRQESEERIKNLGIFNETILEYSIIDSINNLLKLHITVIENWYIYPSVVFELADRNFSEWWINQNRDLKRTNYGLSVTHINISGRRDRLKAQFNSGFRKKYELVYNLPYLTKDGKWGTEAFIFFANQDEIPYKTENNKTIFAGFDSRVLLKRVRMGGAIFYRPDIYQHHAFRIEYHKNTVDEYVINELNPQYFLNGLKSNQFFYFNYNFNYDRRIAQFYPISGYLLLLDFKKEGFGVFKEYNNTRLVIGAEYYYPLYKKLILGSRVRLKSNLDRRTVAFANNTGLGWGDDVLGGYYLYVIDGTDFAYAKNNLRYKLFSKKLNLNWMPLRQFKVMNTELNTRLFFDVGFVNDPTYAKQYNNTFSNRLLYGYGPAVDILLFNNYMISFNLGMNHLNEVDYFFEFRTNF